MDTGSSVSHAGKAAGAVFYMFFDHPDLFDLLGAACSIPRKNALVMCMVSLLFPLGEPLKTSIRAIFIPFLLSVILLMM